MLIQSLSSCDCFYSFLKSFSVIVAHCDLAAVSCFTQRHPFARQNSLCAKNFFPFLQSLAGITMSAKNPRLQTFFFFKSILFTVAQFLLVPGLCRRRRQGYSWHLWLVSISLSAFLCICLFFSLCHLFLVNRRLPFISARQCLCSPPAEMTNPCFKTDKAG